MYEIIAPLESNNNAVLGRVKIPVPWLSSSLQYSSEESLQQRFMAQNFHCIRQKTKERTESEDSSLMRYFRGLLPPLPTKYQHRPSPHKRSLRHVLQSKMRLWHYKRNPFSIVATRPGKCSPDQLNASNLTIECLQSQTAHGPCQYRLAFGGSVGSTSCCCQTLFAIAKEHAIIHWRSLSNMTVVAASGIRVQTARRMQRLDMGNDYPDTSPPRPGPAHPGKRCSRVDSHQAVSLSENGRVEVQSLLMLRPPLRATGSRRGYLRVKQLPEDINATLASVKATDASPTLSAVVVTVDSPLRNACTVEQQEHCSNSTAVACAAKPTGADSSKSWQLDGTSSSRKTSSSSSSRFSCKPLASDQETTLDQSESSTMVNLDISAGTTRAMVVAAQTLRRAPVAYQN